MKKIFFAFYLMSILPLTFSSCGPSPSKDFVATDSLSVADGKRCFRQNAAAAIISSRMALVLIIRHNGNRLHQLAKGIYQGSKTIAR
jgi:hypothetical protein